MMQEQAGAERECSTFFYFASLIQAQVCHGNPQGLLL